MARKPKSPPEPTESAPETVPPPRGPTPLSFAGAVEQAKASVERGAAMLDACIAKVSKMLEAADGEDEDAKYDDRLASHLAWCLDKQAKALATLRSFGEKVKTQSVELTPDQRMRAIAKVIQGLPVTKRDYFRSLLDDPLQDIELVS